MDLRANECAAYLAGHDGYLLISHRRPDGDTLGSGAALCLSLIHLWRPGPGTCGCI